MSDNMFYGVLSLIIGIISFASPETMWYLSVGWKFKGDAEPSDTYLFFTKISGVVLLIVSVLCFFNIGL